MPGTTRPTRTARVTIVRDGSACYLPVPFDPRAVFGRIRAPVSVTLNGYTFRSTIASMGGTVCIPLRRSHREAAGLEGTETLPVTIALDEQPRRVNPPADFVRALKAAPPAWARWRDLSYSHQREYVEAIVEARRPETRAKRIAGAVRMIRSRPARKPRSRSPHPWPHRATCRSTPATLQHRLEPETVEREPLRGDQR